MELSTRHQKKLARLFIIAVGYFGDSLIPSGVSKHVRTEAKKLAKKEKFKDGWQTLADYNKLEKWYIENHVKSNT